jgi:hypothetical protein
MYKISLLLLFTFLSATTFAQLYCPPTQGKQSKTKYHVAAGVGLTFLYGDIEKPNTNGTAGFLAFDYTVIHGLDVGLEGQFGTLEATGDITDDREVKNKYLAGGIMIKAFPFKLFSKNHYTQSGFGKILKESLYVGVGLLGIVNNYDTVYRSNSDLSTYGPISHYETDVDGSSVPVFKKKINSITLPTLNVGLAVPINQMYTTNGRYWSVLLNGQFNFANNDLLDGYMPYDSAGNRVGKKHDFYSFYSVGVRYSF